MWSKIYGPVLAAKADRLGTYAAALAYCFVLSIVPFLVVTFTLGTALTHENLIEAYSDLLTDILPDQSVQPLIQAETPNRPNETLGEKRDRMAHLANLSGQIIKTLQSSSHGGLATIGFILAVYTSFNLMTQIIRTLLYIFDDHRRPLEWSSAVILKTVALFVIWMILLLLFAGCSVMTPVIRGMLERMHLNPVLWTNPLLWGRDIVGLASLFGAFFLTYLLVPSKRYKLSEVRNGSLVASIGWVLCSLLFAKVIPNMWRTNAVYEALGSIVIILIWAQACAWMVIIGACWIVRFPERRKVKKP
jgi:YihY family inner membrane protein